MPIEFGLGLAAMFASAVLTGATIRFCHAKKWLFHPRADRWSKRSVAKFGGLPIVFSFISGALLVRSSGTIRFVLLLTCAMALLGLWDDIRPIKPLPKLLLQLVLILGAAAGGVVYPIGTHYWVAFGLSALWITAITNGFNLLDNMDGLSAGVAMIAALNLYFAVHGAVYHATVLLPFAGALLGFLFFNSYPAKIFMGDAGSLAIGFFIACMALLETQRIAQTASVLFTPVLVVLLPIFDTTLVSITRRLNGRSIGAGARDHSSHRLVLLGLSERAAVLTLYVISAMGGLVAYACKELWPQAGLGLVLLFFTASVLFWLYLAQVQLPEDWLSRTNVATLALPAVLESLSKRALVLFADAVLFGISLYLGFILRFDRINDLSLFFSLWGVSIALKLPALALFGAYRAPHAAKTLREVYPIVKGSLLAFLAMTTICQFAMPDATIPAAVFAIDSVLTLGLLAVSRIANNFFDDVLPGRTDYDRCILVGNASAVFYQSYFSAKRSAGVIRAVAVTPGKRVIEGLRAPQIKFADLPEIIDKERIAHVYVLPDCPSDFKSAVISLCHARNLAVSSIAIKMVELSAPCVKEAISNPMTERNEEFAQQ